MDPRSLCLQRLRPRGPPRPVPDSETHLDAATASDLVEFATASDLESATVSHPDPDPDPDPDLDLDPDPRRRIAGAFDTSSPTSAARAERKGLASRRMDRLRRRMDRLRRRMDRRR